MLFDILYYFCWQRGAKFRSNERHWFEIRYDPKLTQNTYWKFMMRVLKTTRKLTNPSKQILWQRTKMTSNALLEILRCTCLISTLIMNICGKNQTSTKRIRTLTFGLQGDILVRTLFDHLCQIYPKVLTPPRSTPTTVCKFQTPTSWQEVANSLTRRSWKTWAISLAKASRNITQLGMIKSGDG